MRKHQQPHSRKRPRQLVSHIACGHRADYQYDTLQAIGSGAATLLMHSSALESGRSSNSGWPDRSSSTRAFCTSSAAMRAVPRGPPCWLHSCGAGECEALGRLIWQPHITQPIGDHLLSITTNDAYLMIHAEAGEPYRGLTSDPCSPRVISISKRCRLAAMRAFRRWFAIRMMPRGPNQELC